jgi:protein associated with RNAse G/E
VTAAQVRFAFTKYDGSLHWHHPWLRLGEDEHGIWLGARVGQVARRGYEHSFVTKAATVTLLRPDVWWCASFHAPPQRVEVYCDVSTPIRWISPDEVTAVDLDLDVVRARDGSVHVLDQDEFAEHQVRFGYPADVIESALASSAWLATAIADGAEPFATAFRPWLAQVS